MTSEAKVFGGGICLLAILDGGIVDLTVRALSSGVVYYGNQAIGAGVLKETTSTLEVRIQELEKGGESAAKIVELKRLRETFKKDDGFMHMGSSILAAGTFLCPSTGLIALAVYAVMCYSKKYSRMKDGDLQELLS